MCLSALYLGPVSVVVSAVVLVGFSEPLQYILSSEFVHKVFYTFIVGAPLIFCMTCGCYSSNKVLALGAQRRGVKVNHNDIKCLTGCNRIHPVKTHVSTPVNTPVKTLVKTLVKSLVTTLVKSLVKNLVKTLVETLMKYLGKYLVNSLVKTLVTTLVKLL